MNSNLKYLQYPESRDVLFVFGAGASHPDGVPLQRHILPMILNDDEIANSDIGKIVIQFINDNFAFDSATNDYPHLESLFLFLDHFIQQNESLSKTYTNSAIHKIKEYLIKLIHFIVNKESDIKKKTYHKFWEAVEKHNTNISIITLNYDTLLEQAFEFMFKRIGYLDYSFHLMNYNKSAELKHFNFWRDPRQPVESEPQIDPVPFKLIKLHGSLNWKYCNCCNQTLLTPWDREVDLKKGKLTWYSKKSDTNYEYVCPVDGTEFDTLILTPSFAKNINRQVVTQLISEAGREIRIAKKIVFIGYSFSNADVHVRALFKKHLHPDTEVIVINPRNSKSLELKYKSIAINPEFINSSFENFVEDEDLLKRVF
ncbi:MAG: SIR2 family protein [Melioribacteraceae bacterium]|jgi:NAD-dependent SIR2 family protein deacetylase|nr:SIR2 family protein [Melioribacteraceae bacterium]